jgi:hypothetical protein
MPRKSNPFRVVVASLLEAIKDYRYKVSHLCRKKRGEDEVPGLRRAATKRWKLKFSAACVICVFFLFVAMRKHDELYSRSMTKRRHHARHFCRSPLV